MKTSPQARRFLLISSYKNAQYQLLIVINPSKKSGMNKLKMQFDRLATALSILSQFKLVSLFVTCMCSCLCDGTFL